MEELKNIAPELSKLKKENAFCTPRGYFDDFPARMQMKLEAEKNVADKEEFKIINLLKPALGLAASFAIIFMLVYIPIKTFIPQEQIIQTTVSNDYNDQFHTILEELDENSFFSLLESNDTEENFSDDDLVAYVSSNFSAYEIFEYTEK